MQYLTKNYGAALVSLLQALDLYRTLCDRLGEANALNRLRARYDGLGLCRSDPRPDECAGVVCALDNDLGEASAWHNLGIMQYEVDDYDSAEADQTKALELYRAAGDRLGEANTLNALSKVLKHLGDVTLAEHCALKAADLYRKLGDNIGQDDAARFLSALGFNA